MNKVSFYTAYNVLQKAWMVFLPEDAERTSRVIESVEDTDNRVVLYSEVHGKLIFPEKANQEIILTEDLEGMILTDSHGKKHVVIPLSLAIPPILEQTADDDIQLPNPEIDDEHSGIWC